MLGGAVVAVPELDPGGSVGALDMAVELGAAMILASMIVPRLTLSPFSLRYPLTSSNRRSPRLCLSIRCRNLRIVVSSGVGFRPRSMPTNRRIARES